jgi:hypothetical protein
MNSQYYDMLFAPDLLQGNPGSSYQYSYKKSTLRLNFEHLSFHF